MGIFQQFPYSNFHEMNLDQIIKIMRQMQDEWEATKTEWASYKDFIDNYFDTLNLDEETERALRAMVADGTMDPVIDPVIQAQVIAWLEDNITQPTTPAIDTSLTIAGAAADAKATGDVINDLKSDFNSNNIVSVKTLTAKTKITNNVGIGNVVDLTQIAQASTDSVIVDCNAGDLFIITGSGWSSERLWAFVDADNKLISISEAGETRTNYVINTPINASKLVCNFRRDTGTDYRLVAFDTSKVTIKATEQNLTSTTGASICNNDVNNLPINSIYGFVPYSGLANMPYTETGADYGGIIMTLSKQGIPNASMTQIIFRRDGRIFTRQYWGTGFESWHRYSDFVASGQNILTSTVNDICAGDANNLPNNTIYGISIAYNEIANMPFYPDGVNSRYAGAIVTFGKETQRGYGDVQIFSGYGSQTYIRIYAGTWQNWRCLSEHKYNNALGIGDSICEGWRNNNMGFVGMLGVPYVNLGITGATLGAASGHTQIYTEIENISYTKDIIIADGGINDYYFDVPLGSLSSHPVINDTQANALDKTTVSGGLEYLLYLMIKKMPKAQRFFLITHKTRNFPYTQNAAGYTQQQLHDRIVEACKLYNTKVIDVYNESIINSEYDTYVSPTPFSDDQSVTTRYYVDNDRIHPLWLGYQEGYMPVVLDVVQRATTKI